MKVLLVLTLGLGVSLALNQSSLIHRASGAKILCDGFLPPNQAQISIEDIHAFDAGMTEARFNADIDKVTAIYQPLFAARGWKFKVQKLWAINNLNSLAYIDDDGSRTIEIWGGLARSPYITDDALTLVACHEIGHHFGGAPHFSFGGNEWAAVEGQADYFATTKCLRRVFASDGGATPANVDSIAQEKCNAAYGVDTKPTQICMRIAMAGASAAALSSSISVNPMPQFSSPDLDAVVVTNEQHPPGQCRLDTFVNGDLCQVNFAVDFDYNNPDIGACRNIASENYGARPLCWFKPANFQPFATKQ